LRPITNPKMASDLTVGVALAGAAITGALANVEINLGDLKDETFLADVRQRVQAVRA
jgi:glutamate formiminotransferase/formiminotetrahydrofolate cyclodeaminase